MDNNEKYEEVEVTTIHVHLNDTYDIETTKNNKQYTHFHNLMASFRTKYPIRNIINFKDGPFMEINEVNQQLGQEVFYYEGDKLMVRLDDLKLPVYCPLCGTKLNRTFDFNDFLVSSESKYYNVRSVKDNSNTIERTFNYIDCPCCLVEIEKEFKISPKRPLLNPNLYQYHVLFAQLLDFELVNKINRDKRCLYPVDRLAYMNKKHKKIVLLSVFHIANFICEEFKKYFTSLGKTEDEITLGLDILLTPLSKDMFDPDKFKDFRDFEKLLPELADKYYFNMEVRQKQLGKSF